MKGLLERFVGRGKYDFVAEGEESCTECLLVAIFVCEYVVGIFLCFGEQNLYLTLCEWLSVSRHS